MSEELRVIDFFCGIGGMTAGAVTAMGLLTNQETRGSLVNNKGMKNSVDAPGNSLEGATISQDSNENLGTRDDYSAGPSSLSKSQEPQKPQLYKPKLVAAYDVSKVCCDVYKKNWPESKVFTKSIEHLRSEHLDNKADLWMISPPCQPFTTGGLQKQEGDTRSQPFKHLTEVLSQLDHPPKYIFLENVPNFRDSESAKNFCEVLKEKGYDVNQHIASPTQLGFPNTRVRFYLSARRARPSGEGEIWECQERLPAFAMDLYFAGRPKRRRLLGEFLDFHQGEEMIDTWDRPVPSPIFHPIAAARAKQEEPVLSAESESKGGIKAETENPPQQLTVESVTTSPSSPTTAATAACTPETGVTEGTVDSVKDKPPEYGDQESKKNQSESSDFAVVDNAIKFPRCLQHRCEDSVFVEDLLVPQSRAQSLPVDLRFDIVSGYNRVTSTVSGGYGQLLAKSGPVLLMDSTLKRRRLEPLAKEKETLGNVEFESTDQSVDGLETKTDELEFDDDEIHNHLHTTVKLEPSRFRPLSSLPNGTESKLRHLTPAEILRLHGFPSNFVLPADLRLKKQWQLLGNSVHVGVVTCLVADMLGQHGAQHNTSLRLN